MRKWHKKPWAKNILSALAVALFGFILLSLAFMLDFLFQMLMRHIIELFVTLGPESMTPWFSPLVHLSFAVLISVLSWFVFKSNLRTLFKAAFLVVPLATVLVTMGMFLYQWIAATFIIGGLIVAGVIYYLYRTKQHWLYYYATILISIMLAVFTLMGGEI